MGTVDGQLLNGFIVDAVAAVQIDRTQIQTVCGEKSDRLVADVRAHFTNEGTELLATSRQLFNAMFGNFVAIGHCDVVQVNTSSTETQTIVSLYLFTNHCHCRYPKASREKSVISLQEPRFSRANLGQF